MNSLKLSIIIPCFNEAKTLNTIVKKVLDVKDFDKEIIIVDDCSTDQTLNLLEKNKNLYDELIKHPKNSGKGEAVKKGLMKASGQYILFQDADLEYDPKDYKKLLEPVLLVEGEFVIGS